MIILPQNRIHRQIKEEISCPSATPLIIKSNVITLHTVSQLWPQTILLCDQKCPWITLLQNRIQMLQKFNGLKILIGAIHIRRPSILSSIIQIKHGIHIIHTKTVHMENLQPETGIGNQEIHYHRAVIIIKHGAPHRVDCHFRVFHFIKGCSVKFLQTACVSRELSR